MNNKDARPFVDLHKDAEEFKDKFNDDIKQCISFLDSKITALICDPDSLGNPSRGVKSNALVEFSKAKYEIFVGVKSLVNDKEREWMKYISEMKKLFIENVEIFLANTRLEVKLPRENPPSPKTSPGNQRTSLSDSIYPIINKIAKNIPVIGSPRQKNQEAAVTEDTENSSKAEVKSQFNRRGRAASSVKLSNNQSSNTNIIASSGDYSSTEEEPAQVKSQFNRRGRTSASSIKLPGTNANAIAYNSGYSSTEEEPVVNNLSSKYFQNLGRERVVLNKDQRVEEAIKDEEAPAVKRRGRGKAPSSVASKETNIINSRGRRGKLPVQEDPVVESNENNKTEPSEAIIKTSPKKRGKGKKAQRSTSVAENAFTGNEEPMEVETSPPRASTRGRKGKENTETTSKTLPNVTKCRGRSTVQEPDHNEEPVLIDISQDEDDEEYGTASNKTSKKVPARGKGKAVKVEPVKRDVSVSPKKVTFEGIPDFNNLEDNKFAPRSRSGVRRKTMMPVDVGEFVPDLDMDVGKGRSRGKRKTIGGISDLTSAVPPKRLRVADSVKDASQAEDDAGNNLLENGDYSDWMPLINIGAKIPVQPGVYEVKVWRAKKTAFIGSCENLRQKLIVHRLQQNSGHKHLDKFLERNINDIQIRYEVMPSLNEAKTEVKNRVQSFVAQHKTTPAYN